MLSDILDKYRNQKPMDLGKMVEITYPVSAVIRMMEEYAEEKLMLRSVVKFVKEKREPGSYKCLLCGRDKFTHKQPHKCLGGFRKRKIPWQKLK